MSAIKSNAGSTQCLLFPSFKAASDADLELYHRNAGDSAATPLLVSKCRSVCRREEWEELWFEKSAKENDS